MKTILVLWKQLKQQHVPTYIFMIIILAALIPTSTMCMYAINSRTRVTGDITNVCIYPSRAGTLWKGIIIFFLSVSVFLQARFLLHATFSHLPKVLSNLEVVFFPIYNLKNENPFSKDKNSIAQNHKNQQMIFLLTSTFVFCQFQIHTPYATLSILFKPCILYPTYFCIVFLLI